MNSKLKILGVMAIVALAAGATVTSIVRASAPEFHVESAPATLTGSAAAGSENYMTFGEVKLKCSGESSTGTLSSTTSSTLTVATAYSGCLLGGKSAEVQMNGCQYVSHLEAGTNPPAGTVTISCTGENVPVITQPPNCEMKMEPNAIGDPQLTLKNTLGPPADIDRIMTITKLPYTVKNCMFLKDGTYSNGQIISTETLKADKAGGGAQGISAE